MEHFDTKTVHFPEVKSDKSSKVTPIYQTSAFRNSNLEDLESYYAGEKPYLYTRMGNPNTDELGSAVAALENAPEGIATSSGTSAILVGLLAVLKAGDHVVACEDLYGGTHQLLTGDLKDYGIEVTTVSFEDENAIREAIQPSTKMIFTESISNPLLRVEDLNRIVKLAKEYNLVSMIDNTFATPYLLSPFELGVDLVVHSATKYIAGHSDVTAGVLVGREDLIKNAHDKMVHLGTNLGPFDAWLACRGLKTLSVRMDRQVSNAQKLADALRETSGVKTVFYPKYVSEKGNGAMVSIELEEQRVDLHEFFRSLSWVKIVATLAGVETTVSHPAKTSHRALPKSLCEKLGINEHIIRISVGIEDSEDIIKAFQQAILKASKAK